MGRPKAWLPFGPGEVMLQRVSRLVSVVASPVVVVAAPGQDVPPLPASVSVVRDEVSDRGPLQGLAAGLAALPDSVEFAYATATDVPFLEPEWVRLLRERIGEGDLAIPLVGGYHHPLSALYRRASILPAIRDLLANDRMRPVFLVESARSVILQEDELRQADPTLGTLQNLNTEADYRAALADFAAGRTA